MCAKENGANFSPTLLMEEWNYQHKYGGCLHPSKLCDGREKKNTIRMRTPRQGGARPKPNRFRSLTQPNTSIRIRVLPLLAAAPPS
jgi:hypothetical protein